MIAFGSGDPTKIICSALIAQAFDAVRYPILPKIPAPPRERPGAKILHIRNSSLYMPRDFDISPYFEVVKPTIVHGFDYLALHWADKQKPLQEVAGEFGVFPEVKSPSLVPEAVDEAASLPVSAEEVIEVAVAAEVTVEAVTEVTAQTTMVERVTVSEHFLAVEYVTVRPPERRTRPPGKVPEGRRRGGGEKKKKVLKSTRQRQPHRERLCRMHMTIGNTVDRLARQPRQIIVFDLVGLRVEQIEHVELQCIHGNL